MNDLLDIKDNQHIEHFGNLTINGDIGKNARVIIKEGSLVVLGNIAENSIVKLVHENYRTFHSFNDGMNSISNNIKVKKNVGDNVKITSVNGDINIDGDIGNNTKIKVGKGSILVQNIGDNVKLETKNGTISSCYIGNNSTLITGCGDLSATYVGAFSSLETAHGDIIIHRSYERTASLHTKNGNICDDIGELERGSLVI